MADAKALSTIQMDALDWARAHSPFTRRDFRRESITTRTRHSLIVRGLVMDVEGTNDFRAADGVSASPGEPISRKVL